MHFLAKQHPSSNLLQSISLQNCQPQNSVSHAISPCKTVSAMQSPCKTVSAMQSPCKTVLLLVMQSLPTKQHHAISLQNNVSHAISPCKTVSVMQSLPAKQRQSCNQLSTMDSPSVNKKKVGPHHINNVHCAVQEHVRWRMWLLVSNIPCKLHQQHAVNTLPKQLFLFPVGWQKTCYATQRKWWILVNLVMLQQA